MFVTVAICTFNRAESLRRTLDSLVAVRVPNDLAWEVVIVNNNSSDCTDDVIGEYIGCLPVRREFETRPGKSNALNRAIDVAKGDYIIWIDDDVVVDAGWLTAYIEAFRYWPDAAVFGGRIKPRYEAPVQRWIIESEAVLGGVYAIRDFGDQVYPLSAEDEDHYPYGGNWAIRATEQRIFRYNPQLGPVANRYRTHEEYDVIQRVLGSGAIGYWIPEAMVEHYIGRERQTTCYIAIYYENWGETWAFLNAAETAAAPFLFGIPRRIWPRLLVWWVLYRFCRFAFPTPVWLNYLAHYAMNKGAFRYWHTQNLYRKTESSSPAHEAVRRSPNRTQVGHLLKKEHANSIPYGIEGDS
jgi:glycosyltransferase involved in cell wall biosynthesis